MKPRRAFPLSSWLLLLAALGAVAASPGLHAQTAHQTVAVVNGKAITLEELDRMIDARLRPLQRQIYVLRKSALENLIVSTVLQKEAGRKGISVEELRKELASGAFEIPTAEVEKRYAENAEAFASLSADEAKERVRIDLETQERMRQYRDSLSRLKQQLGVEVLLEEPKGSAPPAAVGSVSRAKEGGRVTVTEFSDFQCPFCRAAHTTVKRILREHENDVRFVFKHLPLGNHPRAFDAARAAFCAAEQNRFWEYHDLLFSSDSLTTEALNAAASRAGLDRAAFAECVSAERSKTAVMNDVREARRLGITGTPTFIINGTVAPGAIPYETFEQILNRELTAARTVPIAHTSLQAGSSEER